MSTHAIHTLEGRASMVNRKAKSAPVPISTNEELCAVWCEGKAAIKIIERKLETLKKLLLAIVPKNRDEEHIPATNKAGYYIIKKIVQDRRKVDDEALMELMREKLTSTQLAAACRLAPDHD